MKNILNILILIIGFSFNGNADEISNAELDKRLYKIEKALRAKNPILPMDATRIRMGGFLTSTYSVLFNDKETETSFNSNRFEILLSADLNEKLDFFTAFGIISESELLNENTNQRTYSEKADGTKNRANKVPLIISRGNWKFSEQLNIKFGRFVAPFGIINIEHFPPGLFLETAPIALRPIPGGNLWAHFLNGVDVYGKKEFGSQTIGYHLNYSTFSFLGPANPVTGGNAPGGDSTEDIFGGRLWWQTFSGIATLGASWQNGLKLAGNKTYGLDLDISWGNLRIKNEFTQSKQGYSGNRTTTNIYMFQPSYAVTDKVRVVYRYDYLDPQGSDNNRDEHILGVNWLPTPLLRLRMEYSLINFENRLDTNGENPDYTRLTTSAVLSF